MGDVGIPMMFSKGQYLGRARSIPAAAVTTTNRGLSPGVSRALLFCSFSGETPPCLLQLLVAPGLPGLGEASSSLCPSSHGTLLCVASRPSYSDSGHIGLGPTLLQYELILTDYICSDPISKQSQELGARTLTCISRGTRFNP